MKTKKEAKCNREKNETFTMSVCDFSFSFLSVLRGTRKDFRVPKLDLFTSPRWVKRPQEGGVQTDKFTPAPAN